MLIRDRLLARLAEMGGAPDHQRLAAEVLGIRNATPELARRLVAQALVVEDRREAWRRAGEQIAARAPAAPGVYVLRDESARAVYVGKANNLRRRLRAHFATRRWRGLKAPFARIADAEWQEVGSEIEALLREASLIEELQPAANVQVGAPNLETRAIPATLVRDVIVVVPSVDPDIGRAGRRARRRRLAHRTHAARRQPAQDRCDAADALLQSPLRDRFERPASRRSCSRGSRGRGATPRGSIRTMRRRPRRCGPPAGAAGRRRPVCRANRCATLGNSCDPPKRSRREGGSASPHAPLAQLDRASGYEPGGRRFESCRARDQPFGWSPRPAVRREGCRDSLRSSRAVPSPAGHVPPFAWPPFQKIRP